jgi:hypothetical protein
MITFKINILRFAISVLSYILLFTSLSYAMDDKEKQEKGANRGAKALVIDDEEKAKIKELLDRKRNISKEPVYKEGYYKKYEGKYWIDSQGRFIAIE